MWKTTGLALPQPLITAFGWPTIRPRVTVDGVVAVIDAEAVVRGVFASDPGAVEAQRRSDEALDHESPLEELFEDQLNAADLVVLTKTDLLSPRQESEARAAIRGHARVRVPCLTVTKGEVRVELLIGQGAAAEDDIFARRGHHGPGDADHDHDDFASFAIPRCAFASEAQARTAVEAALAEPGVLRIKGHVAIDGRPAPLVIQAVGPRIETWYDTPGADAGGLVVIGLDSIDQRAISAAIVGEVAEDDLTAAPAAAA